jgi:YD repeat-containing protein
VGFRAGKGRRRWVAVFALLLAVSSGASAVTAGSPGSATAQEAGSPASELPASPSDGPSIQEGLELAEQEEAAAERALLSPSAVEEREQSRQAFTGLAPSAAKDLLLSAFSEQMAALNADPARFLSDAEIVREAGPTVATVRDGEDGMLLDAGMPVRTETEAGFLAKVDLSLIQAPDGFKSVNPLTDVELPTDAEGAIKLEGSGVSLTQVGAEAQAAERLGDENLFYPEALGPGADTDLLISPIAAGLEVFHQLRSVDSPEAVRLRLGLPADAILRSDGDGGAEVVRGDTRLVWIRFPHAVDAQGAEVPVDLAVEGDEIVLNVPHRDADLAYPILLDPAIFEDWYNANWFNGHRLDALTNGSWKYSESNAWIEGSTSCIYTCWGGGRGLYVSMPGGAKAGGQWGEWSYSAPNAGSYLVSAWANPFVRNDHNCHRSSYPNPKDFAGMQENNYWVNIVHDRAITHGYAEINASGRKFIIGLTTGNGSATPCWRDLALGGAAIWLDDWQNPTLDSVTGVTSGWISKTGPFTLTANTHDEGLGISRLTLGRAGGGQPILHNVGCNGLSANRCPYARSATFSHTGAAFDEGVQSITVSATDPVGKISGTWHGTTMVDGTAPEVTLSGQLAAATNEGGTAEQPPGQGDELSLPVYNLTIAATDIGPESDANKKKRSGVKDIEIWLDGKEREVPWAPQACPASSCSMSQTYSLKLTDLVSAGQHTLEVKVLDQVGNPRVRKIEFEYIPATGIKDEHVMHYFPLPDGQGSEAEEEHPARPELAVNVMNGNLVYREKDVDIERAAVDLEVERYYNSQLPEAENTEWGDGWTLAQTPELEPIKANGSTVPNEAEVLESSSAFEGDVALPTQVGVSKFDPALQATLSKKSSGGYELTDETGEAATSVSFDHTGQAEALLTEGYAKVDLEYAAGKLTEIAVEDPATAALVESEEEPQEPSDLPTYQSAFGSYGLGNGQFQYTRDVALDTAGNVWVIDLYGERVQQFTPGGQFIRQVGAPGGANGQFSYPSGIAAAPDGTVWVADAGNSRIQQFGPNGEFLQVIGGWSSGQFSYPEGIAVAPDGKVRVADTANNRVVTLSPQGQYLSQFGSEGTEAGQFSYPAGIDVDLEGNVWVVDTYNSRIQKFGPSGEYLLQAGGEGSGDGQLQYPMGIVADPAGMIWVADTYNSRIEGFDSQGQPVGRFGSEGTGAGQLLYPMGIGADPEGGFWVADTENNRVQHWQLITTASKVGLQMGGFGSSGSAPGKLAQPRAAAVDDEGNVWVADAGNHRVQEFDPEWNPIGQFGTYGTAAGQLASPSGVAVDPDGNVWVADTGNHRLQKFDANGDFLLEAGSQGSANGQFNSPSGVATDAEGNVWVADTGNHRVQQLGPQGQFIRKFGSQGSANGQFVGPSAVAIDGQGNVWVADLFNGRVQQFDSQGGFIREFGVQGSGDGQLSFPQGLTVDRSGDVWVADTNNNRVQGFSATGKYLAKFGSAGSGESQLSSPRGIAATPGGNLLIADTTNNRLRLWRPTAESDLAAPPPGEADPAVDVAVVGGLVQAVEGNAAGEHSYAHSGNDLVAHDGPDGETKYEYDIAGRMTKVTLPNGNYGSIAYHGDGRVKSVTVKVGSDPAKTTEFQYSDEPRSTTVTPPDAAQIVYDIGADGSVLKWRYAEAPPDLEPLGGSLYDEKEKLIATGAQNLVAQAISPHGIASIEVIADGNVLVDEARCEQDPEKKGLECLGLLKNEWVVETSGMAPGIMHLEVIATDRLGRSESERFWVDVPYTPPEPPGALTPPKYSEIKKFREEYGLEVVFPVADELQLNDRIFELMAAWHNPHTPVGEVARASWERWGVPLRAEDVAELEYRQRYLAQNGPIISQGGEAAHFASYAGYYVDHRAGGKIRIGFTSAMSDRVADISELPNLAARDRITPFPSQPAWSLQSLRDAATDFRKAMSTRPDLAALLTTTGPDIKANRFLVGTTDLGVMADFVSAHFGSNPAVKPIFDPTKSIPHFSETNPRERPLNHRLYAGDRISSGCTLAFGAQEYGVNPNTGAPVTRNFALTAGHCDAVGTSVRRLGLKWDPILKELWAEAYGPILGKVARNAYSVNQAGFKTDIETIRLTATTELPRWVYWSPGSQSMINGESGHVPGGLLCHSGNSTGVQCGVAQAQPVEVYYPNEALPHWVIKVDKISERGDSGSPVVNPVTGSAVGIHSGGRSTNIDEASEYSLVAPLLPLEGPNYPEVPSGTAPGLDAAALSPRLHIVDCCR